MNQSTSGQLSVSAKFWHVKVHNAVKHYYINTLNKTEQEWKTKVLTNHRSFNLIWRSALKPLVPDLELNGEPPPERLRKIYLFPASVDKTESATT